MKHIVLMVGCLMILCSMSLARDYYVSVDGVDKNPGTKERPLWTIQKAADKMTAGDTCYVRAGTYYETVKVKNSGTKEKPISFVAWPKEAVTISGIEPVEASWVGYFDYAMWTGSQEQAFQTSGKIRKEYTQLFVDGEMMTKVEELESLDGPNKWFGRDEKLYLWPPEPESGAYNNPANHKVEGKVSDYAFEVADVNYVVIRDFHFFAATIKFENCDYCTIDNCSFSQTAPKK